MFFNAIKMELDHFYFHSLINLDTLSRLPPNTDITLTNGYITPVAGKMSSIVGAQTVYNTIHRYDVAQCVSELDTYLTNINKIGRQSNNGGVKFQKIYTVYSLQVSIGGYTILKKLLKITYFNAWKPFTDWTMANLVSRIPIF